jgi:hypothetical protein
VVNYKFEESGELKSTKLGKVRTKKENDALILKFLIKCKLLNSTRHDKKRSAPHMGYMQAFIFFEITQ